VARGDGLREGTQSVLAGLDDPQLIQPGLRGVLGNRLRVRPGFERAVEAALGSNLEAILVRDAEIAEAIFERLAAGGQGEVSLLAPEWMARPIDRQVLTVPEGAECWAVRCVETDDDLGDIESLMRFIGARESRARDHGTTAERADAFELSYAEGIEACNAYFPDSPLG